MFDPSKIGNLMTPGLYIPFLVTVMYPPATRGSIAAIADELPTLPTALTLRMPPRWGGSALPRHPWDWQKGCPAQQNRGWTSFKHLGIHQANGQNIQLVGGWTNPFEKYAQVKMGDFLPQFSRWKKKYWSCHHPDKIFNIHPGPQCLGQYSVIFKTSPPNPSVEVSGFFRTKTVNSYISTKSVPIPRSSSKSASGSALLAAFLMVSSRKSKVRKFRIAKTYTSEVFQKKEKQQEASNSISAVNICQECI